MTAVGKSDLPVNRLHQAMFAVASDLSLTVVLREIVESATTLVDAQYGALGVIGSDGRLTEFINTGFDDATVAAIGPLPKGLGILGRIIIDAEPLRLSDLTKHPDSFGFPPGHPAMHSFLGVPIRVRDEVFGNLYLCEKRSASEFSAEDESLAIALAAAAGVAIENARLHAKLQELVVFEERERIARDLHDKVIQRLFATGMSLQATERLVDEPEVARRLVQAVDDLDTTIREIRNTIFALHTPTIGLHVQIAAVVAEVDERLGVVTNLHVEGPIDLSVPPEVADHVPTVVREALTNAWHHGRGSTVDVVVRADADCMIRVVDNGTGITPDASAASDGCGLTNLASRAESLGGTLALTTRTGGGTVLEWKVPLGAS